MAYHGFTDRWEAAQEFYRLLDTSHIVKVGQCGLAFLYKAAQPDTRPAPKPTPPTPVVTEPPPKVGSVLDEPPIPDAKPRRDAGPVPRTKSRKGTTKQQRQTIVARLHGIHQEDATDTLVQLTDTPGESTITFKQPEQAHNLYFWLTAQPLFEEMPAYKRKAGYRSNGRNPVTVPGEADKAMQHYGHPAHAAALLKRQAEAYEANGCKLHRLFYSVVSELESRAQDKTWYSWGRRDEADWFKLETRLAAIGQPLTAAGQMT